MPRQYTQKQIDELIDKLPEELSEALFSMETAKHIWDIREKYDVMDERGEKIPSYVGYVLMGLMLPQEFEQALKKEMKIPKKTAEQVAREINRFIFYPVKPALEQLHRMEIEVSAKVVTPQPGEAREEHREERPEEDRGPDKYREPIE